MIMTSNPGVYASTSYIYDVYNESNNLLDNDSGQVVITFQKSSNVDVMKVYINDEAEPRLTLNNAPKENLTLDIGTQIRVETFDLANGNTFATSRFSLGTGSFFETGVTSFEFKAGALDGQGKYIQEVNGWKDTPLVEDDITLEGQINVEISRTVDVTEDYDATVFDQFGNEKDADIVYTLASPVNGVSIDPVTGIVTITPEAEAGTYTVVATSGDLNTSLLVTMTKEAQVPTYIELEGADDVAISASINVTEDYDAFVKDQASQVMDATIVYSLEAPVTGVSIDSETGIVTITPQAQDGDTYKVVATSRTLSTFIVASMSLEDPRPDEINMVGPEEVTINKSDTLTPKYTAIVKDQFGNDLDEVIVYSLESPVTGVSIDPDTGSVTITKEADPGTYKVIATSGSLTTFITTIMKLEEARPDSIEIEGPAEVTIKRNANVNPIYTATVRDQYDDIYETDIVYSLQDPITGVGIDSETGTLTVTPQALDGQELYVVATGGGLSTSMKVTLTLEPQVATSIQMKGPNVITIPDTGSIDRDYLAQVKDQADVVMDAPIVYSLSRELTGVSIDPDTGKLTVAADAQDGEVFDVIAVSGDLTISIEVTIVKDPIVYIADPDNTEVSIDSVTLYLGYGYTDADKEETLEAVLTPPRTITSTEWTMASNDKITLDEGKVVGLNATGDNPINVTVKLTLEDGTVLTDTVEVYVIYVAPPVVEDPPSDPPNDPPAPPSDPPSDPPSTPQPSGPSISLDRDPVELEYGTEALEEFFEYDLTETITGSTSTDVTWSIDDDTIATVDQNGVVRAVKQGETKVTVTHNASGETATSDVIVFLVGDEPNALGLVEFYEPYIFGYPDQTFRPKNSVTRAEVATMFAKILKLNLDYPGDQKFADVNPDTWYYSYVQAIRRTGLFVGDDSGNFRPDEPITRAEMATVFGKFWQYLKTPVLRDSVDIVDVDGSHWASSYIYMMYNAGIVTGFEDGTYRPNDPTLREQVVGMINTLIARPAYEAPFTKFTDMTSEHWAFGNIEAASQFYSKTQDIPSDQ